MSTENDINNFLQNIYDLDANLSTHDEIQKLIEKHSWDTIQPILLRILKSQNFESRDYRMVATFFAQASEERKPTNTDLVSGLIFLRLSPELNKEIEDHAWSTVCEIKGLNYMDSDYDPRKDPAVIKALKEEGIDCSDWEATLA